ncbi:MAG TPA: hypothetical protein VMX38_05735 [Verrucomicrobiae bacterium]|nr:hypothetical protein [Verrucomicrobiae bacterium]
MLPEAGNYIWPNLSPDGTKLPLGLEVNGIADVWVVDVVRHTKTRLTSGPLYSSFPIWWPDGKSSSMVLDWPHRGLHPAIPERHRPLAGVDRRRCETNLAEGRQRTFSQLA